MNQDTSEVGTQLPPPLPAMLDEARRWSGTPHKNRMAKPGVGIDCLHLLREMAVAAKWLPPFAFPYYDPAWGFGRQVNVIERILVLCCHSRLLKQGEPLQDGDVMIWAVGRQSNHCGIFIAGEVWHAQASRLVQGEALEDVGPFQSVVRITEAGFKRRPETLTDKDFKP